MKKQLLIIGIVLAGTVSAFGQNFIGLSQSKIINRYGTPDEMGTNYIEYIDLNEDGKNIYYFDENKNCISFILIRNTSYFDEYQKMLNKEFTKSSDNKYFKKSKKICYLAELTISKDLFQIWIKNTNTINSYELAVQ